MCASRGALVRRWNAETGAPGPPHSPTDLLPSCASLCLSVTSRHFSLPYALPTYTCNACAACTCIHARSWIVFSLASECNRVGVGEPLARVPVLVLCRSRGRILSRVVPAHTIFACALDENYCVCVCVREGGEGRRRVDAVFFFWVDL